MNMTEDTIVEANDKIEITSKTFQSPFLPIFSFWKYKTREDKMARNLWLGLALGFLASSCLAMYLLKVGEAFWQ